MTGYSAVSSPVFDPSSSLLPVTTFSAGLSRPPCIKRLHPGLNLARRDCALGRMPSATEVLLNTLINLGHYTFGPAQRYFAMLPHTVLVENQPFGRVNSRPPLQHQLMHLNFWATWISLHARALARKWRGQVSSGAEVPRNFSLAPCQCQMPPPIVSAERYDTSQPGETASHARAVRKDWQRRSYKSGECDGTIRVMDEDAYAYAELVTLAVAWTTSVRLLSLSGYLKPDLGILIAAKRQPCSSGISAHLSPALSLRISLAPPISLSEAFIQDEQPAPTVNQRPYLRLPKGSSGKLAGRYYLARFNKSHQDASTFWHVFKTGQSPSVATAARLTEEAARRPQKHTSTSTPIVSSTLRTTCPVGRCVVKGINQFCDRQMCKRHCLEHEGCRPRLAISIPNNISSMVTVPTTLVGYVA
ncbi:hypothetical protein FB451DRAFT_1185970 [Mycena latifolia]|nr:hypothetical protein FB451DRAFT_1185970 [Mycena latifolia]